MLFFVALIVPMCQSDDLVISPRHNLFLTLFSMLFTDVKGPLTPAEGVCGAKLISRECVKLLADNGSKFLYSFPSTPTLNSVVKRNHCTTFDSCHAMVNESGLPKILWAYAAEYSTYIFNCLPIHISSDYMSPI